MINIPNYKEDNPQPKLPPVFTGLAASVLIFFIYQFAGSAIYLLIFGLNSLQIDKFSSYEIIMFRFLTIGGQILFMLFPTLLITKFVYPNITDILRARKPNFRLSLLIILGFILLTPILQYLMSFQNIFIDYLSAKNATFNSVKKFLDTINENLDSVYNKVMISHNLLEFFGIVIFAALTPAICEEFLFRGLVQKSFELKFKAFWAIFLSSFIFSIFHFNPYGLIPLILLSMYFGFAVYITDSILISIILHFSNNFFSIFVMNVFDISDINKQTSLSNNVTFDISSFVVLVILFLFVFKFIINYNKQIKKEEV